MLLCFGMPGLTPVERIVLSVVAFHDGERGCFASVETLADECGGLPRRGVFRALRSLERKGRITRTRRRNEPSVLRVVYGSEVTLSDTCESRSDAVVTPEVSLSSPELEVERLARERDMTGTGIGVEGAPVEIRVRCGECGSTAHSGYLCAACGCEDVPHAEFRAGEVRVPLGGILAGLGGPRRDGTARTWHDAGVAREKFLSDLHQAAPMGGRVN